MLTEFVAVRRAGATATRSARSDRPKSGGKVAQMPGVVSRASVAVRRLLFFRIGIFGKAADDGHRGIMHMMTLISGEGDWAPF